MSVYFVKNKGWRFDFIRAGQRCTAAWFKTKRAAKNAEAKRREEITGQCKTPETQTDMGFLELVNRRLDYAKAFSSERHYMDFRYLAGRWIQIWRDMSCGKISPEAVERFVLDRSRVSAQTANKEICYLRATFNYGKKKKWTSANPTEGLDFLPAEKKVKYVPSQEDIEKVIAAADADTKDYLWAIHDTMARVSEINRLCWDDVAFQEKYVLLYTRKKRGGHLTPRKVPMTRRLSEILSRRFQRRKPTYPGCSGIDTGAARPANGVKDHLGIGRNS